MNPIFILLAAITFMLTLVAVAKGVGPTRNDGYPTPSEWKAKEKKARKKFLAQSRKVIPEQ